MADGALVGHVAVLLMRLESLKAALLEQPGLTDDVKFQYDRVLRSATKLEGLVTRPDLCDTCRDPDHEVCWTFNPEADCSCCQSTVCALAEETT